MKNKIVTFVIVMMSYILEWKKVAAAEVKPIGEGLKFSFPNTWKGRTLAEKLRRRKGFENSIIILTDDHGTGLKLERGMPIILMSLPDPNQVVKGVLNMTGDNKSVTVELGRQIISDCTSNIHVSVASGLLTVATTSVNNYEAAHEPAVHEFYRDMIDAFEPILQLFNTFVKVPANRSHGISTLQSGGFHVVGPGGNHLAVFGVRTSVVAGQFLLTGNVDPDGIRGLHDWWFSLDNINWTRLRPTKNNHTKSGGYTRGQLVYFRHELIVEDVDNPYGLSDPISRTAS